MNDSQIVHLYWQRDESALSETLRKYGNFCFSISYHILYSKEDSEECVNDTLLGAWNAMPPHRPEILSTFLGKITRRLSLQKWRHKYALKRGGGRTEISLFELEECISSDMNLDENLEAGELTRILNMFLEHLPTNERRVFLRRYWYFDSIREIASRFGFGESKVKMMLKRTRDKLQKCLEKEEIWI